MIGAQGSVVPLNHGRFALEGSTAYVATLPFAIRKMRARDGVSTAAHGVALPPIVKNGLIMKCTRAERWKVMAFGFTAAVPGPPDRAPC
jgi:hypothetical protein